jgi:hypothetical protein
MSSMAVQLFFGWFCGPLTAPLLTILIKWNTSWLRNWYWETFSWNLNIYSLCLFPKPYWLFSINKFKLITVQRVKPNVLGFTDQFDSTNCYCTANYPSQKMVLTGSENKRQLIRLIIKLLKINHSMPNIPGIMRWYWLASHPQLRSVKVV